VLLALAVFLNRTRHGIAIRALASNQLGAELVGIHVERITFAVMILGSGLAGLAGVLLAGFYFVSPVAGWIALLKALIVTILGGLGNPRGTVMAAFLVGLLESGVSTWLGTRWSLPMLFAAIAILLVVRPSGLAGRVSFGLER
jgi:branched-chain amino acid transport system permease protein